MKKEEDISKLMEEEVLECYIRLAFLYMDLEEAEALKAGPATEEEKQREDQALVRIHEKMEKSRARMEKAQRRASIRKAVSRVADIAACIVLVVGISIPIAIANVETIRIRVLEMLVSYHEDHIEIKLQEDEEKSFDVPAEWRGKCYPSEIPEGYELTKIDPRINRVRYSDSAGNTMVYSEMIERKKINIDYENAIISFEAINGMGAVCIEKEGNAIIAWTDGERIYVLQYTGSKEAALGIAAGIRKLT